MVSHIRRLDARGKDTSQAGGNWVIQEHARSPRKHHNKTRDVKEDILQGNRREEVAHADRGRRTRRHPGETARPGSAPPSTGPPARLCSPSYTQRMDRFSPAGRHGNPRNSLDFAHSLASTVYHTSLRSLERLPSPGVNHSRRVFNASITHSTLPHSYIPPQPP